LEAFADCDEANCAIGTAIALGNLDEDVKELLLRVQNDLFDVGADLCTPVVENPEVEPLRVTEAEITALEVACDKYNAELKPLRSFILPGGTAGSALLHVARTVVRRAERSTWTAFEQFDDVNILAGKYLNRLSDLLFILARYANRHEGDVLWVPGKNR
jgi:cob(I)alamin adenosyltransferase